MSTTAEDKAAPAALSAQPDSDETREWVEAIEGVLEHEGPARAQELIGAIVEAAQRGGAHVSLGLSTPYINTIPASEQQPMPGNDELETRIRHYVRWNAMAMVARANKESSELGGHVASFASAATLYDVGFNYFFRAPSGPKRRRSRLLPRALGARILRARVHRRPHHRRTARKFPARS